MTCNAGLKHSTKQGEGEKKETESTTAAEKLRGHSAHGREVALPPRNCS